MSHLNKKHYTRNIKRSETIARTLLILGLTVLVVLVCNATGLIG